MTAVKRQKLRWSICGKLMLFLCLMSVITLLMVWALTARFLQPLYNNHIYKVLSGQMEALASRIDASEEPISTRNYWTLMLNEDFWNSVNKDIVAGKLNLQGSCVDVADNTLRSIAHIEHLHPCLLHDSDSGFGSAAAEQDTYAMIALRAEVTEQGQIYKIVESADGARRQMVVGRLAGDGQYTVILSTGLAQVDEASVVLGDLMPLVAVVLLVLSVLAAWLFSRWFTRPITQLSRATREMAQGNYQVRLEPAQGGDELDQLARDFDHMAGEVNKAAQMQKDLLANVSHDLRTPLTLIKGYAETVRDLTGGDAGKRTEQLNVIVDETDRLAGLVNSVMELSKVSSGTEKPQPVRFDMAQLCEEVAARYEAVCAQNGYTLQLQAEEPCPVYADPAMMERVLHNLLGNAMHHIGEDGAFQLRCTAREGGEVLVEVEDHGPGIAKEDLPYIFDRYYRSRSDSGKVGTGLGLSITKAVLQSHGCRFGVSSTLGQGSTFWFVLADRPRQPPEGKKAEKKQP